MTSRSSHMTDFLCMSKSDKLVIMAIASGQMVSHFDWYEGDLPFEYGILPLRALLATKKLVGVAPDMTCMMYASTKC